MTVGAHRRRLNVRPPPPRCIQCDKEDQIPGRSDKLGINCATYKDRSAAKIAKAGKPRPGDDT
jgi:hypothetical protein